MDEPLTLMGFPAKITDKPKAPKIELGNMNEFRVKCPCGGWCKPTGEAFIAADIHYGWQCKKCGKTHQSKVRPE